MPDLNPDGTVYELPSHPSAAEVRARAVEACGLCDEAGYVGTLVCSHEDHRPAAVRGMAEVRKRMGWTNQSSDSDSAPLSGPQSDERPTSDHPGADAASGAGGGAK